MDLSMIQRDILITLITLYHQNSASIKGEEIAEVLKRNPGTVRNQMQALKSLGLVEGVPGPKGGYTPTSPAYTVLNLPDIDKEFRVPLSRNDEHVPGVNVSEIDFTTLCHPDICHAVIKLMGSVKQFEIGDNITIGPSPVNKLLIKGEVFGKDEMKQSLLVTISEMISLPKRQIRHYMSTPLERLEASETIKDAMHLFHLHRIHGAPVFTNEILSGIVTLSDIARGLDSGLSLDDTVSAIMTSDVVIAPSTTNLYEVIGRFKEQEIGRLIVMEEGKPVGIVTQSDIIRVFPSI